VLHLFTDNFDYQQLRRDFVVGTLNERELGRGLHSFPFPLNLSLLCPIPLLLSSLCPPYNPNQTVDVARRCPS
jgi:hypothetical protein